MILTSLFSFHWNSSQFAFCEFPKHLVYQDIWQVIYLNSYRKFLDLGPSTSNSDWWGWIIPYIFFFFTGSAFLSAIFLALATYQSLYPLTLFVPGLLYLLQVSTCWSEASTQVTFDTWPGLCLREKRAWLNQAMGLGLQFTLTSTAQAWLEHRIKMESKIVLKD